MIEIIAAVIALASAIAAIFSARASSRSAAAAKASTDLAARAEHRSVLRQLLEIVENTKQDAEHFATTAASLKSAYQTMKAFTSAGGRGSTERLLLEAIQQKETEVDRLKRSATDIGSDYSALHAASVEDLSLKTSSLRGPLANIRRLCAELESELANVSAQNRLFLEQRMEDNRALLHGHRNPGP